MSDLGNPKPLRMLLIDQVVSPEQFFKLDTSELASESLKAERNFMEKRGMDANRSDWENELVKA